MGGSASYRLARKIRSGLELGLSPDDPRIKRDMEELQRLKEAEKFQKTLKKAKESQDPSKAWRVDVHKAQDYVEDKTYVTEGGSTIAVTPSGDIISVCKNQNDTLSGSDLLAQAVEMGGVKLDSYGKNHAFYTKNGFEPVSWCEWDDRFAPDGWDAERDDREPIIFYKYTGNKTKVLDYHEFTSRVPASADYDAAQKVRDDSL